MANPRVGLNVGLASLALVLLWRLVRRPKVRHPPSPTSLPLVGNLFSIPPDHEHVAFAKLGEQLKSDIVFLEIFGHQMLVLNSAKAALELLEKRSALYSDRPIIPMITEPGLMNWSSNASIIGYNDIWRHYRRIMNNWLNMRAVTQFTSLQERQARMLLQRLLSVSNHIQPFEHVKNEFYFAMGSLMLRLAYGYQPQDPQDQFLKELKLAFHNVLSAGMQTSTQDFFVNIFPALSRLPDWFPGTSWKRTGREWGAQQDKAKTEPYEWLKNQVAGGDYQPSLLAPLLQDHKLLSGLSLEERDKRLKEIGIILYGGGTDTSSIFLVNLVAAMVLNPHVQARSQRELDTVLGQGILPSISDKERLPYVRGVVNEVLRLYPVLPLAVAHACFQDDTYRGYEIQKGTIMVAPITIIRAIGRDVQLYEDPGMFNPERYLDPTVPQPPVFGWGRRKCPGIHFAETSIFIAAALILSVFTFSKRKDGNGNEISPQLELERNSLAL
ncbi:cytochrome P450 family protein [Rhizoctonia solani 123E]|uniref:Cytochrome P450 family protein n=1 Tax=Rhizoctonia solani 123E TaxID=1423351 RepID=A0A074S8F1_9AGAM|nr:cytochrome P450 family protein [Rhizoctonia solani 123E]